MACTHTGTIDDVTPSAEGCEECLRIGGEWVHLRLCREVRPRRLLRPVAVPPRACWDFHGTGHPIIEGYDPPEGWGWCYVDDVEIELPDQTPQRGPIPRFF